MVYLVFPVKAVGYEVEVRYPLVRLMPFPVLPLPSAVYAALTAVGKLKLPKAEFPRVEPLSKFQYATRFEAKSVYVNAPLAVTDPSAVVITTFFAPDTPDGVVI